MVSVKLTFRDVGFGIIVQWIPNVLQRVFALLRKPILDRQKTYAKIAERLNEVGYRKTNGKFFNGNTVLRMLQNWL